MLVCVLALVSACVSVCVSVCRACVCDDRHARMKKALMLVNELTLSLIKQRFFAAFVRLSREEKRGGGGVGWKLFSDEGM